MPSQNSRNSPIEHLLVTEEEYVEDLKYLLQKVKRCWDYDNPLSPKLQSMFSALDIIYSHNNNFHSRLRQIGTDPHELGNTLMSWIEEMEGPYTKYCQNYKRGVDLWPDIENNYNLQYTLSAFSSLRNQPVTLGWFFLLPLKRIHYYKKLYMRILRNSEPGRPDYDILSSANKRLDSLIELEERTKVQTESVIPQIVENTFISPIISGMDGMDGMDGINDTKTINLTLSELESQLDTTRVMNLLTGQTKVLNVQLLPPHLPFRREIILHDDFTIILSDIEKSNNTAHLNAHLILCTDLLLICKRLTAEEKENNSSKEFCLLYQPLSGRHLSVNDLRDDREELLNLVISERQLVIVASKKTKSIWFRELNKMVEFSKAAISNPPTPKSQLSISVQENTGNTGNFLSPPLKKVGLPSSPLSNNAPRSRSRSHSRSVSNNSNASSVNNARSRSRSPASPPSFSPASPPRGRSPASPPRGRSPASPPRGRSPASPPRDRSPASPPRSRLPASPQSSGDSRENRSDVRSLDSVSSVSSIASFTDTVYQSSPCGIYCWVVGEWIQMTKKERVIVEIRWTNLNKPCWTVILESSKRLILNGWIHPGTSIQKESTFEISVSCEMGQSKEFYKISSPDHMESDALYTHFIRTRNQTNNELLLAPQGFMSRSSSLNNNNQASSQAREIEIDMSKVMESEAKLFLQNDHGVWTNLGRGRMKLLLETPSYRKRLMFYSDSDKSKVIDTIISDNVMKKKSSITFKINNTHIVYMLQMNEANASKVMEIMKTKKS